MEPIIEIPEIGEDSSDESEEFDIEEDELFLKRLRRISKIFVVSYIGYLVFINVISPYIILKTEKTCFVKTNDLKNTYLFVQYQIGIIFLTIVEFIMRLIINQGKDLLHIWYSSRTYFESILVTFKIIFIYHYSVYVINHWDNCDILIQIQQVSKLIVLSIDIIYKLFFKRTVDHDIEDDLDMDDAIEPIEHIESPNSRRRTIVPNYSFHRIYLGKECVVCLEQYDYNADDVIALACGHVFHIHCVAEQEDCPICRIHMPLEDIVDSGKLDDIIGRDNDIV